MANYSKLFLLDNFSNSLLGRVHPTHHLRVEARVMFKIYVLAYIVLSTGKPSYLREKIEKFSIYNHTFPEYLISTLPHPRRMYRHTHRPRKRKIAPKQPLLLSPVVRLITPPPLVILPGYTAPPPIKHSILISASQALDVLLAVSSSSLILCFNFC